VEESSYNSVSSLSVKKKMEPIKMSEAQRQEIQEELKQMNIETTMLNKFEEKEKIRPIELETLDPI